MKELDAIQGGVVGLDADGNPVLLVETKVGSDSEERGISQLAAYMESARPPIPFAMLVTGDKIRVYRWTGKSLSEPILELSTSEVLSYYEPSYEQRAQRAQEPWYLGRFDEYMTTLVEAWLRDMAYHWKSEVPPYYDAMSEIGLASLMRGGRTVSQLAVA